MVIDPGTGRSAEKPVCVVYDCLFPHTVGGAERWYRELADALQAAGRDVVYLTRTQWDDESTLETAFRVLPVTGRMDLYDSVGQRRILPTLRFGWGVFKHLVRNRHSYGHVHVANFPFFSLIAARLALIGTTTTVFVDWHEVWSWQYWKQYGGPFLGSLGFLIQRLCIRLSSCAFVFCEENGRLLATAGLRTPPIVLAGLLPSVDAEGVSVDPDEPHVKSVLFAGRHIADKGIDLVPGIFAEVRRQCPDLHLVIAGDGPMRSAIQEEVSKMDLEDSVHFVGFLSDEMFRRAMSDARCLLLPSRREGYGMIVAEATAVGTPVVVAAFPENNAVHLVEEGINGIVVAQPTSGSIAAGVVRAVRCGSSLRDSTLAWSRLNLAPMSIDRSLERVLAEYEERHEVTLVR